MLLDEFVEITVNKHNAKYLMNLGYNVEYELDSRGRNRYKVGNTVKVAIKDLPETSGIKVSILCDFCNKPYKIQYRKYIERKTKNEKCACNQCKNIKQQEIYINKYGKPSYNGRNYTIDDVRKIFESQDLSLVSNEYINAQSPLEYICNKHIDDGIQNVTFNNLQSSIKRGHHSCKSCSYEHRQINQRKDFDEIKQFFENRHCTLLTKKSEYINAKTILLYECDFHPGIIQKTTWMAFRVSGGCSLCLEKASSHAETIINNYLLDKNIKFNREYWFEDCKDIKPLPFDFAIQDSSNNIVGLCEFNGKQHYEPIDWFGGNEKFKIQQLHDEIKRNYCLQRNIPLLVISYKEFCNIEKMLDEFIEKIFLKGVA